VCSTRSPSVGSARAGRPQDRDVFGEVYSDHLESVYGLARRVCGSSLAADVTQEVFVQLWRRPESFDSSRGSLRALLLTMAHNKSVDQIRSESARRTREQHTWDIDSSYGDVDDDCLADELIVRVVQALDRLPMKLREAVVTAFYGQCTYRQAAIVLDLPEGTVKARIRRGLEQLRMDLEEAV